MIDAGTATGPTWVVPAAAPGSPGCNGPTPFGWLPAGTLLLRASGQHAGWRRPRSHKLPACGRLHHKLAACGYVLSARSMSGEHSTDGEIPMKRAIITV